MRLNTANRAFVALMVAGAVVYALAAIGAAGLLALIAYRPFAGGGLHTSMKGLDLRPVAAFLVPFVAGTVLAFRSLRRQIAATVTLSRRVRSLRVPSPAEVILAASRTRLTRRVDVVRAAEPFSFAYGLGLPRVAVSEGLLRSASPQELEAVLEHERYHVVNLDPLKVVVATCLSRALFYFPALRGLRRRYVAGRELAADRRAAEVSGRTALAGALYKVVRGPEWEELPAAAAIGGTELLDARVEQLETGREPDVPGVSLWAALVSTISLGLLAWAFSASLAALGGPVGRVFGAVTPGFRYYGPRHFAFGIPRLLLWILVGRLVFRRLRRRHVPVAHRSESPA